MTRVTIEDRDYVVAVSEARARLAARRPSSNKRLPMQMSLKQLAGESNPSDLALKKPQIAQARAGVQAAELSLSRAESDLSRTQISLPFDARITETMVDEGQYVGVGRTVASVLLTDVKCAYR